MFANKEKLKKKSKRHQSTLYVNYDYSGSMNLLSYQASIIDSKEVKDDTDKGLIELLHLAITGNINVSTLESHTVKDLTDAIRLGERLCDQMNEGFDISTHLLSRKCQFDELVSFSRTGQKRSTVKKFIDENKILF